MESDGDGTSPAEAEDAAGTGSRSRARDDAQSYSTPGGERPPDDGSPGLAGRDDVAPTGEGTGERGDGDDGAVAHVEFPHSALPGLGPTHSDGVPKRSGGGGERHSSRKREGRMPTTQTREGGDVRTEPAGCGDEEEVTDSKTPRDETLAPLNSLQPLDDSRGRLRRRSIGEEETSTNTSYSSLTPTDASPIVTKIPVKKYGDEDYLARAAKSKYKKGIKARDRGDHELAKSKFRQALKARMSLNGGDVWHLSLAPVQEMIGRMDKELGNYRGARLSLMASLEISEAALRWLEEREGGDTGDKHTNHQRRKLTRDVNRVRNALSEVKALEEEQRQAAEEAGNRRGDSARSVALSVHSESYAMEKARHSSAKKNWKKVKPKAAIIGKLVSSQAADDQRMESAGTDVDSVVSGISSSVRSESYAVEKARHRGAKNNWKKVRPKASIIGKLKSSTINNDQSPMFASPSHPHGSSSTYSNGGWSTDAEEDAPRRRDPKNDSKKSRQKKFAFSMMASYALGDELASDDGGRPKSDTEAEAVGRALSSAGGGRPSSVAKSKARSRGSRQSALDQSMPLAPGMTHSEFNDEKGARQTLAQSMNHSKFNAERGARQTLAQKNWKKARATGLVSMLARSVKPNHSNKKKVPAERIVKMNRDRYREQKARGEGHFSEGQYAMAMASFNCARTALLIAMDAADDQQVDSPLAQAREGMMDRIHATRLSELIVDCRLRQSAGGRRNEDAEEEGVLHAAYDRTVAMLVDVRKELLERIKILEWSARHRDSPGYPPGSGGDEAAGAAPPEKEASGEGDGATGDARSGDRAGGLGNDAVGVNQPEETAGGDGDEAVASAKSREEEATLQDFRNLVIESTISLARIHSKQGCASARRLDHLRALDSFAKSITNWQESAELQEENYHPDRISVVNDPLVTETQRIISSSDETDTSKLKNTIHIEALGTALSMAISHHHLGIEARTESRSETAIHQHLQALRLAFETQQLRADIVPARMKVLDGEEDTLLGAATSSVSEGGRVCILLRTLEQVGISCDSFRLGRRSLAKIWLMKAIDSIGELGLSNAMDEARAAVHVLYAMTRGEKKLMSSKMFAIYWAVLATAGYNEEPGFALYSGLEALEKGMAIDALRNFEQAASNEICNSPTPPVYCDEVLHAIDAKAITLAAQCNMDELTNELYRRLDVVSRWIGNPSVELANDFYRLACIESLRGNHQKCAERLGQSQQLSTDCGEESIKLEIVKLRAVTCDALDDTAGALSGYERAVVMEESPLNKAMLMNATAHLHLKTGGQCHLDVEFIEKSLRIQQDAASSKSQEDADLLTSTKILYGNAMASKDSFDAAIQWYDSALRTNPDQSPINPNNLRALYNKGVALFRSRQINAAGKAFALISDEVGKASKVPNWTSYVLNAIGSIYFASKEYDKAIDQFKESLDLGNNELTPTQRAGTMCNIAMAFYKKGKYEESAANFNEALRESESAGDSAPQLKATIMKKLGHVMYGSELYTCANTLFTEAAYMGTKVNQDHANKFSHRCEGYAEICRHKLINPNFMERICGTKPEVRIPKPKHSESLIPITDCRNTRRYRDAVLPAWQKLAGALRLEAVGYDKMALISNDDTDFVCKEALSCLMKRVEDYKASYGDKLNAKFAALESILKNELKLIDI